MNKDSIPFTLPFSFVSASSVPCDKLYFILRKLSTILIHRKLCLIVSFWKKYLTKKKENDKYSGNSS